MRIKIPTTGNRHMALAAAIESAKDGDILVVTSDVQKQLGLRAKERMCPSKNITFECRPPLKTIDYQYVFREWANDNRLCQFDD